MSSAHPIPVDALDDRMAFVGTSGSGKTYAAGTVVEQLLDSGARVVIVDPLDVWWGLRTASDGAGRGFDIVILGGKHGDLALNEDAGATIGAAVATSSQSVIVVPDLKTGAAQRRFMRAFLAAIYENANCEPVHLVFDEADLWAPQRATGETAVLLGLMEEIVRRGRVKGFIPWLITQRPAVTNKDVLSQADGMIAMKLTGAHDRTAISDWIGRVDPALKSKILDPLPTFEKGQGIVWIPARQVLHTSAFPRKRTYDSSRTPERGEARPNIVVAPIDIEGLRAAIAPKPTSVSPSIHRAKNGSAPPAPDRTMIDEAERAGYVRGRESLLPQIGEALRRAEEIRAEVDGVLSEFRALIAVLESVGGPVPTFPQDQRAAAPESIFSPSKVAAKIDSKPTPFNAPARHAAPKPKKSADSATNAAGEKLLAALVRYNGVRWTDCCIAAGVLHGNGYFYGGKKWLLDNAYAEEASGVVVATDLGVSRAGECGPPMSLAEIVATWAPKLRRPAPAMLAYVAQHRRRPVTADELAQAIGAKPGNGYWYGGLKPLRAIGLIEQNRDIFQLSDFLARAP